MRICSLMVGIMMTTAIGYAKCSLLRSDGAKAPPTKDPLYLILKDLPSCPTTVQGLRAVLHQAGLQVRPAMVANRGRHNFAQGSFSFFEQVSGTASGATIPISTGEFFFGHFTAIEGGQLVLDQNPSIGKLLVELIAWDWEKQLFNFYELIGNRAGATWFYRGDSADAIADTAYLHRTPPLGTPKFGTRMRCSACHVSGGPIMKELAKPHNDWWRQTRPLPLGDTTPAPDLVAILAALVDAPDFARSVQAGIHLLEQSPRLKQLKVGTSLQEQLCPLFCTTEINLASSLSPLESNHKVTISSGFFVHLWLAASDLTVSHIDYVRLLQEFKLRFPETMRRDADHGWLTPVNSYVDFLALEELVKHHVVDKKFIADVLAIDFTNPLFSAQRCGLLKLVPQQELSNWLELFIANPPASAILPCYDAD